MEINTKFIAGYFEKGLFWFRFFGYGIHGKDTKINRLFFSERNGYTKLFWIGKWAFSFLKPMRPL